MDFILLKIIGLVITFGIGFVFGKYWYVANSVSDIEKLYNDAAAQVSKLKAQAEAEIASAQAQIEKLKAIV